MSDLANMTGAKQVLRRFWPVKVTDCGLPVARCGR